MCRVKWFDKRDGQGIACEMNGSEFYIDDSVIKATEIKDGDFVYLWENLTVTTTRCGMDLVKIKPSEFTKREFQIAASIRFGIAQMRSAENQIQALRNLRMAS